MTEWAWCQNALENKSARSAFAQKFFEILRMKFPNVHACHKKALVEIENDVEKIYLRLSYGGRRPSEMHPRRLAWLRETFLARH